MARVAYQGLVILSFALFFAIVVSCFLGDTYIVKGNLHDLWIPQMGAYAIKSGMVLHQDFHTSFGFVYNGLNYISLLFAEGFPDIFNPSDMIMLSSVLFSVILIALFILMRVHTKQVPWLLLPYILSYTFQLRGNSDILSYEKVLWYQSYNFHLWSLLLLQGAHIFAWLKAIKNNSLSHKKLITFCFIQTFCVYMAFNYKINYFAASCLIAASPFFFFSNKSKVCYAVASISFFGLLILIAPLVFGYSYTGYIKDVLHVVESTNHIPSGNKIYIIHYCLILFLVQFLKNQTGKKILSKMPLFTF